MTLYSAFIVKPIPGSDALSYKRGFSLVHFYRRSERRQIVKAADNIWTLFKFVRTSRWQLGTFSSSNITMTLLPARERRDKHGLTAAERKWEKREVVEGWKKKKKVIFFCQVQVQFHLCGGRRALAFLGGMDTHVKEGQLYVQHQKFGKVRPRNRKEKTLFLLIKCCVHRNKGSACSHSQCYITGKWNDVVVL